MSALNDKINSYAIKRGIEFNYSFVGTVPPISIPVTGTSPTKTWVRATSGDITYDELDGPIGGAGSWRFGASTLAAYYRSTVTQSFENEALNWDESGNLDTAPDYSVGFWFKIEAYPTSTSISIFTSSGGLGIPGINVNITSSGAISYVYNQSTARSTNGGIIQPQTWYYFAFVVEAGIAQMYLNGQKIISDIPFVNPITNYSQTLMFSGSTSAQNKNTAFNISNYYLAEPNIINEQEIIEIWQVGSTDPNQGTGYDVKYYNGTSWEQSVAQKYYDGNAWVDWNNISEPKRWDGTQWINLS